jgi:hypothetical protein
MDKPNPNTSPHQVSAEEKMALRQRAEAHFANRGAHLTTDTAALSPDATQKSAGARD